MTLQNDPVFRILRWIGCSDNSSWGFCISFPLINRIAPETYSAHSSLKYHHLANHILITGITGYWLGKLIGRRESIVCLASVGLVVLKWVYNDYQLAIQGLYRGQYWLDRVKKQANPPFLLSRLLRFNFGEPPDPELTAIAEFSPIKQKLDQESKNEDELILREKSSKKTLFWSGNPPFTLLHVPDGLEGIASAQQLIKTLRKKTV